MSESAAAAGWQSDDALLLAAICGTGRRGSTLLGLLRYSDAANLSYPGEDQAATSLGRLLASGLIERHGDRYRETGAGRAVGKRGRGSLRDSAVSVLRALAPIPLIEAKVIFAPGEFDAAMDACVNPRRGRRRRRS